MTAVFHVVLCGCASDLYDSIVYALLWQFTLCLDDRSNERLIYTVPGGMRTGEFSNFAAGKMQAVDADFVRVLPVTLYIRLLIVTL